MGSGENIAIMRRVGKVLLISCLYALSFLKSFLFLSNSGPNYGCLTYLTVVVSLT